MYKFVGLRVCIACIFVCGMYTQGCIHREYIRVRMYVRACACMHVYIHVRIDGSMHVCTTANARTHENIPCARTQNYVAEKLLLR